MTERDLKKKRINLSMTEGLYALITEEADKAELSLSAYSIQAIEKNLGKIQKMDPKLITIEPIDIYTDDIRKALSKIGNTASKLDRLVFTLSQKSSVADYELKRLVELITQMKEEEKEFNQHMETVYEDRLRLKKEALKKIERVVKKATS